MEIDIIRPMLVIDPSTSEGLAYVCARENFRTRYQLPDGRIRVAGEPDWKPISETRHALLKPMIEVVCSGCSRDPIYYGSDEQEAKRVAAEHDARHSKTMGECCMYSHSCVCETCGNVLV